MEKKQAVEELGFNPAKDLKLKFNMSEIIAAFKKEKGFTEEVEENSQNKATLPEEKKAAPGTVLWRHKTKGPIVCKPFVIPDGKLKGCVLFTSKDRALYCINPFGKTPKLVFKFDTKDEIVSSPVYFKGKIYFGSKDKHVYAVSAETLAPSSCKDGKDAPLLLWKYETGGGIACIPQIASGLLIVTSWDKNMYAFDISDEYYTSLLKKLQAKKSGKNNDGEKGDLKWQLKVNSINCSPLVDGGNIYVGTSDKKIISVNYSANSANIGWTVDTKEKVISNLYLDSKGMLYGGAADSYLYVINIETGKLKWRYKTGDIISGTVAVEDAGDFTNVYIPSLDNYVHGLQYKVKALKKLWKFKTKGKVMGSALYKNNNIYVGSTDNYMYALDSKTGNSNWKLLTGGNIASIPIINNDILYFGSDDGYIYAVQI